VRHEGRDAEDPPRLARACLRAGCLPRAARRPLRSGAALRVEIDTDVEPRRLEIPTGTDGIVPFERAGRLDLPGVGSLDVWWLASYGGGLFVPVRDALAGTLTYGGGRYLIDTAKGADLGGDGRWLVTDLNFAYNPSCAYDPAWACPLAQPSNTVAVALRAGELSGER
jgi:hypothetical protein